MFSKYKVTIWNFFCFLTLFIPLFFIYPHLFQKSAIKEGKTTSCLPLTEKESIKKVWKRGKYPSVTTLKEKSSSSNLDEEKSHSADDWVSITWRKKNDP
jgi:hypothetical protein